MKTGQQGADGPATGGEDAGEVAQAAVQEQCFYLSKRKFEDTRSGRNLKEGNVIIISSRKLQRKKQDKFNSFMAIFNPLLVL